MNLIIQGDDESGYEVVDSASFVIHDTPFKTYSEAMNYRDEVWDEHCQVMTDLEQEAYELHSPWRY